MYEDDCGPMFHIRHSRLSPNFLPQNQRDLDNRQQRGKEYHDRGATSQVRSCAMRGTLKTSISPQDQFVMQEYTLPWSEPNNQLFASVTSTNAAETTTKSKKNEVLQAILFEMMDSGKNWFWLKKVRNFSG
jgi:hypothetical protein